jgi:hypothetical protein
MVGDHMGIPRTVVFVFFVIGFSHRLPACLRHTYHRRMSLGSVVRDAVGGGYMCEIAGRSDFDQYTSF